MINTADDGYDMYISTTNNVRKNTSSNVILRKRESSREAAAAVKSYADFARRNIGKTLDQYFPSFLIIDFIKVYFHWTALGLSVCINCLNGMAGSSVPSCLNNISLLDLEYHVNIELTILTLRYILLLIHS